MVLQNWCRLSPATVNPFEIGCCGSLIEPKIFAICTKQAKSKTWTELGLEMNDKNLRFEVLSEAEGSEVE